MPTILVEITSDGDSCENCNLVLFEENTEGTPYCAAGHPVVCTEWADGYFPNRPPECKSKEVGSAALRDQLRQRQCSQCGAIGELVAAFALAPVCDKCAELLEYVTTDHTISLFSEEERHHILRCAHERAHDWNVAHASEYVPSRQRLHANAVYGIPRFPKLEE